MSASLITTPPALAFTRNDMPVVLETDNITPDRAYVELTLNDYDGPFVDETFNFTYNDTTRTFTFKTTPDNSGWQLPVRDNLTQTPEEWWDFLAEHFRINTLITQSFDITSNNTAFKIRLTWRNIEPLSITTAGSLTHVDITDHDVASIVSVTNLGAYITIHDATTHEKLIALSGSYDYTTMQCAFDIQAAFDQLAILPPVGAGGLAATFKKYYVRYADRYGTPAAPELMPKSDNLTAILGGTNSRSNDFLTQPISPLHSWLNRNPTDIFRKEVSPEQPDWLYFVSSSNQANLSLELTIYLSNGDSFGVEQETGINLVAGEVNWIPSGYTQRGIQYIAMPGGTPDSAFIIAYDVRLRVPMGGSVLLTAHYTLDTYYHPWNLYLLFDTGLGGMESVRLKGKKQRKYDVEKTLYENESGALSTAFAQGNETTDVSTGWYPLSYLEQLRQLLMGDIYVITASDDLEPTYTFQKVIADTKSFEFITDDNDLHSLTFAFKNAQTDEQVNFY